MYRSLKFRENACVLVGTGFEWGEFFLVLIVGLGLGGSIFGFGTTNNPITYFEKVLKKHL